MASTKTIPLSFTAPIDDAKAIEETDRPWHILQEAHFETDTIAEVDWYRLDTIQLKTKSTGEYRDQNGKLLLTWFNIAIHRPKKWKLLEPRFEPRADFTHGGSLRWRSHTNQPKAWYSGQDFGCLNTPANIEYGGRVFTQLDELLKQLDYRGGDVIVVSLCARSLPAKEYKVEGDLVLSLLDTDNDLNKPMASYGRYRYWPTEPCPMTSEGPDIKSKIWLKSAPLDTVTISKLDTVRLFTESRDQGWVGDNQSASYSWFDLVILDSENGEIRKTKEGVQLAWRSHSNSVGGNRLEILDGLLFTREDDLLRGLEDGNVIAARVSCRFRGWENNANDGCLELRFSPNEIKDQMKKIQISEEALQTARLKNELLKIIEDEGIQVPKDVLRFLNEPVTADRYIKVKPKLMLLSLDGGGVRGLASLYMLRTLMKQVQEEAKLKDTPEPSQVFDLMVGTSTGGLIAIMLGRLGMKLDDCITAYMDFAKTVFAKPKLSPAQGWEKKFWDWVLENEHLAEKIATLNAEGCYDSTVLEKTIKSIVQKATQNEDSKMQPETVGEKPQGTSGDSESKAQPETPCRVVVNATPIDNIAEEPTPFRTYPMDLPVNLENGESKEVGNCTIWEAARATTAAPFYFQSIKIGTKTYVDGGLRANNPVFQTITEGMYLYKDRRPADCLVSLGTGQEPTIPLSKPEGNFQATKAFFNLAMASIDRVTERQHMHVLMKKLNSSNTLAQAYYRFDPELWDKHQEGKPDKLLGLEDVAAMEKFEVKVKEYMEVSQVRERLEGCAKKLAERWTNPQA